jgi:hypothetical protein
MQTARLPILRHRLVRCSASSPPMLPRVRRSPPPDLPVLGSSTHLRRERRVGSLREARSHKGETAVDVPGMGSTDPRKRKGGVGDEEMSGGQAYAEHQAVDGGQVSLRCRAVSA